MKKSLSQNMKVKIVLKTIVDLLQRESLSGDRLFERSGLETSTFNIHMTMLEIKGIVQQHDNQWRLAK